MKKFYFELDDSNHRRDLNIVILAETVEDAFIRLQQLLPVDEPEVVHYDFNNFVSIAKGDAL